MKNWCHPDTPGTTEAIARPRRRGAAAGATTSPSTPPPKRPRAVALRALDVRPVCLSQGVGPSIRRIAWSAAEAGRWCAEPATAEPAGWSAGPASEAACTEGAVRCQWELHCLRRGRLRPDVIAQTRQLSHGPNASACSSISAPRPGSVCWSRPSTSTASLRSSAPCESHSGRRALEGTPRRSGSAAGAGSRRGRCGGCRRAGTARHHR